MVTGSLAGSLTCGNHVGHTNLVHLASLCPNLGFRVLSYKRKLAWENLFFPFTLAVLWSQVTWDLTAQHCLSVPENQQSTKWFHAPLRNIKMGLLLAAGKTRHFRHRKKTEGEESNQSSESELPNPINFPLLRLEAKHLDKESHRPPGRWMSRASACASGSVTKSPHNPR